MPAVVSSTEGSCVAGTSEPLGRRLWSRASKKERNVSRISSDLMALGMGLLSLGPRDGGVADDRVAGHQARRLPGGGAVDGLVELELEPAVRARSRCARDSRGKRARAVAQLDPVDGRAVAVQRGRADHDSLGAQVGPCADRDAVARRVGAQHVQGLSRRDAEAAALADGVVLVAAMAPEDPAVAMHDLPGPAALVAVAGEEAGAVGTSQEAQVLRVGL